MPRKTGKLNANKTFLLVVEGCTEKIYFSDVKANAHIADSMPAFEVWFLLHYAMLNFFYSNQDGLIKDLKKHIPDYSKNQEWHTSSALYAKLKPYFDDAMENSRNLNAKRGAKVDGKSTLCNVYKLFEELLKVDSKNCNCRHKKGTPHLHSRKGFGKSKGKNSPL